MAKKVNIEITNPVGLYASPATELVDAVKLYKSHVTLNYNEKSVNMIVEKIKSLEIGTIQ